MKAPRLLILDLDGTLYYQRPLRIAMARMLAAKLLSGQLKWQELQALRHFRAKRERAATDDRPLMDEEICRGVASTLGLQTDAVEILLKHWLYEAPLKQIAKNADRELLAAVREASAAGVKTAVFSDYRTAEKLDALGLAVDAQFASTDAGIRALKPNPQGLFVIAEQFGLHPTDCLMVGDRDDRDGECARRAGMPYLILPPKRRCRAAVISELKLLTSSQRRAAPKTTRG